MTTLYNNDCLKVIKEIADESIDCVITSPPYDDLRNYDSQFDCIELAKQLYRTLKDGGVIVWNVNDKIKNGSKSLTSFKQAIIFNEVGFNVNDVMIWKKKNPIPQVKQPRYNQCFEYMFIFSKGKPKTFNPIMVKCDSANLLLKTTFKKATKEKERQYKELVINDLKISDNIWEIAVAQNDTIHPAVFPLELPMKHIETWTNKGDVVLDCFMGSGTSGIACKLLKRDFIGIEINEIYFNLAKKRIDGTLEQMEIWDY